MLTLPGMAEGTLAPKPAAEHESVTWPKSVPLLKMAAPNPLLLGYTRAFLWQLSTAHCTASSDPSPQKAPQRAAGQGRPELFWSLIWSRDFSTKWEIRISSHRKALFKRNTLQPQHPVKLNIHGHMWTQEHSDGGGAEIVAI